MDSNKSSEQDNIEMKKVIVISKEQFYICKKLLIEKAPLSEFSKFLGFKEKQAKSFLQQMQKFENYMCAKRRADNLKKERQKYSVPKKRFQQARELISKNLSSKEIAEIMKLSVLSVRRFRRKISKEKLKLQAEGIDDDPFNGTTFKLLPKEEKAKKFRKLIARGFTNAQISKALKMCDRSVQRWRFKLKNSVDSNLTSEDLDPLNPMNEPTHEPEVPKRMQISAERFKRARELIAKNLGTNKIAKILKMSERSVTRFKAKIRNEGVKPEENLKSFSNIADRSSDFKQLSSEEKLAKIEELIKKRLTNQQISTILGISDRSVLRWKHRIDEDQIDGKKSDSESDLVEETNFKNLPENKKIEKFKDLFDKGVSTSEISNILHISTKSVQRWRLKLATLEAEGDEKNQNVPNSVKPDYEDLRIEDYANFKTLSQSEKFKVMEELFRRNLTATQIAEIVKITDRSVRRWREKLNLDEEEAQDDLIGNVEQQEEKEECFKKLSTDKKLRRVEELVQKGLTVKEIAETLKLNERSVQRWKNRLQESDNDEEEDFAFCDLVDPKLVASPEISESETEFVKSVRKRRSRNNNCDKSDRESSGEDSEIPAMRIKIKTDPDYEFCHASTSMEQETDSKMALNDRNVSIARLLRQHGVRTMDIARLMNLSESSVTRLLSKSKNKAVIIQDNSVLTDVERMLAEKDRILDSFEDFNETDCEKQSKTSSKRDVALTLFSMNAETTDIAQMLGVSKKTVQQWKKEVQ